MMNLIEEAIIYSTIMHQGKTRKMKNTPYILHPLEVANIISTMTDDQEVIAAGVLHDIVEETDGTLEEIRFRFGERVAMIVESESENDYPGEDRAASWKKRKENSLKALKNSKDIGVKMLWLADKLANMRSLAGIYSEQGEKLWSHLHQSDPDEQRWYYQSLAEYIEMDLNRTGAYKELIKHINFIWPGTFDTKKTRYRQYREVSIEGCEKIGSGDKADIYRYDDELIVKVYNDKNTYRDVEQEITLARKAFVLGVPTAISFGIVSVGSRYGAMFELVDASTVSELIARNPGQVEYYAELMADVARLIHATEVPDENEFPDATELRLKWLDMALHDDEELASKIRKMILAQSRTSCLVHGDFHTGNVFIQNEEPLLIDMDNLSIGPAIYDLSDLYLFYVAHGEKNPRVIEDYMGFSYKTSKEFYRYFMQSYLQTQDENRIQEVTDKAAIFAYLRLLRRLAEKSALTEADHEERSRLKGIVRELADRIDDLAINN